jgi:allantoicase
VTVTDQNAQPDRADFLSRFGAVFEHSPWIADQVYTKLDNRNWRSLSAEQLINEFNAVVLKATRSQQMDLLNAHPQLACAISEQQSLTEHSRGEQSGAGLDQCTKEEFEAFRDLNLSYRETFGFPFILAIKGLQKEEILAVFRERITQSRKSEFLEALNQVCKIGGFRITDACNDLTVEHEHRYHNLVEPALGGAVIEVSDDFFAPAKRMLAATEPEFHEGRFDEHGKWMDGWESRRKRSRGNDYCVIRICPGVIYGLQIDTAHFTGNYAPAASLEAAFCETDPDECTDWTELLPRSDLKGNTQQYFRVGDRHQWSHLRLRIFPDGGIARLRVYGISDSAGKVGDNNGWVDLACSESGGHALCCNDMHFGHMSNLIKPGNAANMGDGWETRRRRKPGNDWVVLKLGKPGEIKKVEVDTDFFKGNYPAACSIRGCLYSGNNPEADSAEWPLLLNRVALGPDQLHVFHRELKQLGPVSHVRMDIYPDGGVARLRLYGEPDKEDKNGLTP